MKFSESQLAIIRKVLTILGTVLVTKAGINLSDAEQAQAVDWVMAGLGIVPVIISAVMSKKNADKLDAAK